MPGLVSETSAYTHRLKYLNMGVGCRGIYRNCLNGRDLVVRCVPEVECTFDFEAVRLEIGEGEDGWSRPLSDCVEAFETWYPQFLDERGVALKHLCPKYSGYSSVYSSKHN